MSNQDYPRRSSLHLTGTDEPSDLDVKGDFGILQKNGKPGKVDQKSIGKRPHEE